MSKALNKKDYLKIPILNNETFVILTIGNSKKVSKVLKKFGYSKKLLDKNSAITIHSKTSHPIIVLKKSPTTPKTIGLLAHEATHAIEHVFKFIEEKGKGEIFAISVEAIVREGLKWKK